MKTLRAAWLIAMKDLRIELRTGDVLMTTGLFAVLVAVITSVSFFIDPLTKKKIAPGILWVTVAFSGVLAMGRIWAREREQDVMRGLMLAPVPRASIYLGKAFGSLLFLTVIELLIVPLVMILFQLDELGKVILPVTGLLVLGTVGFVGAGTLFSAMSVKTTARDLMLSVVLFPLTSPALLAGVVGTRELLLGAGVSAAFEWGKILLAFDIVFVSTGLYLFETLAND